jgi:2-aminoadipate transaminase
MPKTTKQANSMPTYMQIRNQLREQILRGDLAPGAHLPPERKMAQQRGVSRTTIVAAYDELLAEGLVESRVGHGTVVVPPAQRAHDTASAQPIAWPAQFGLLAQRLENASAAEQQTLGQLHSEAGLISLAYGSPDPNLFPVERFNMASQAVLSREGSRALDYSERPGIMPLRELIAARLSKVQVATKPENVLVTHGSMQGLDLLLRLLTDPGDCVIVESPTYLGALQAFQAQGLRVVGVPVNQDGMDVERVEFLLARYRPKFIYTVPTFQNPTGATMTQERRSTLLSLARRYQVPIVEDDPFSSLYFDSPPPPPIKALDDSGHVIYVSTLSKCLAPGLRVGYITGAKPVIDAATLIRKMSDLSPNTLGQYLVVEFAERGWLDEHIALMRATNKARCETMDATLKLHLPADAKWRKPTGGAFIWLELPDPVFSQALLAETRKHHVVFLPGHLLYVESGRHNGCRLNFGWPNERDIERAIAIIGASLRRLEQQPKSKLLESAGVDAIV